MEQVQDDASPEYLAFVARVQAWKPGGSLNLEIETAYSVQTIAPSKDGYYVPSAFGLTAEVLPAWDTAPPA